MATPLQQVKLVHESTVLTCWVDKHVKVGDLITLRDIEHGKDEHRYLWTVLEVYENATRPEHGWHVGGM